MKDMILALADKAPFILMALGFALWAAARFVESKASANPESDNWDKWAPKIKWASNLYSQAIDWLADTNNLKLGQGQTKLGELNRLVKLFEDKVQQGKYIEAITEVTGFWMAAKNKLLVIPPSVVPLTGSAKEGDSKSL